MPVQLWVNVYDVIQHYGGAEEGGWFYDVGIPEWSAQGLCHCHGGDEDSHNSICPIHHLVNEAKVFIAGFKPGYLQSFIDQGKIDREEPEYRGEAIHGRKEIRVEGQTGHAFPESPPHYE